MITERVRDRVDSTVPEWFIDLFPISAEPGQAQISDSWMHFGVIKVAGEPNSPTRPFGIKRKPCYSGFWQLASSAGSSAC